MSPFARHGIKHLSASSLNLFAGQPAMWIGRYLLGWRDEFGPAAKRGTAVEAGLDSWLYSDRSEEAWGRAKIVALENFALNTNGIADDAHEAERANIHPMLWQARIATRERPIPLARQLKIEFWIDGIEVPVIGFLDYVFEDCVVDLKTTKRMPSNPSKDHLCQMAGYMKARNQPVSLLYVTDKKNALRPVSEEEAAEGLADMERAARALRACLANSRDAREAARFYVPDLTDFRWSDETRALCRALYEKEAA